ncbi:MAG: hypothetical protein ABIO04_13605, partial [Ferruginibacter sp.]
GGKINFNAGTSDFITYKEDVHQLDYISGGSLFTHANSFMEIGLLPEEYFLYWEEADWCYRAKNIGYSLLLCDQAICYDKVSTTIGKGFLADYYYTRNGLQFLSKFKNVKVPTALFFSLFRFIIRIVSGQPTRARGVYAGMRSFLNKKMHAYK